MALPGLCGRRFCSVGSGGWVNSLRRLIDSGCFQSVLPVNGQQHLEGHVAAGPRHFYCGYDPTADSLHLGHLLTISALLRLRCQGHHVVFLVGGATGLIGDPSGRLAERPGLATARANANAEAIECQLRRMLANCAEDRQMGRAHVVNNSSWYSQMSVVQFVSEHMANLRLHDLLNKHTVQSRLNSKHGISLKEFVYPIFQSYDWLHLYRSYGCLVQVGGHDQTGNIDAGIDFLRRSTGALGFGLTVPLLTTSDGRKLGKSEKIADTVWLSGNKTAPFAFYQRLRNTPDSDVPRLLRLLTLLTDEEVERATVEHAERPDSYIGQSALADNVTQIVHGAELAASSRLWTRAVFGRDSDSLASLRPTDVDCLGVERIIELDWRDDLTIGELVGSAGFGLDAESLAKSASAGRLSINLRRATDLGGRVTDDCVLPELGCSLLKLGRKQFAVVRWRRQL